MKKLYVLAGALFMATGAFAQGHDLFFSAYNEGAHPSGSTPPGGGATSNGQERAMQIFNPTNATVNMDQYSVARYSNGATAVFQEEQTKRNFNNGVPTTTANNLLQSSDVFVIGAEGATLNDIVNNMDQRSSAYSASGPTIITTATNPGGPVTFDGNDAMVLRRWTGGVAGQGTPVIIDIFGVIGQNPGSRWSSPGVDIFGNPETVESANQSLVRKSSVENGIKINPDPNTYQIGDQWEVFSKWVQNQNHYAQDYSNLVGHAGRYTGQYGSYAPLGVLEDFNKAITLYPNPATNKSVTIRIENTKVADITIMNVLGQNIKVAPANAIQDEIRVDISSLKPGLYFVKFVSGGDYKMTIYKELLVN